MGQASNIEKAARLWRHLILKAKPMPDGPEKDAVLTASKNALRTLGKAVDAAEAHEAWAVRQKAKEPER